MISRKDSLLIRPWQQKEFEQHRQKVKSALPAIDTGCPPYRSHVAVKSKKQQKERERCKKIEKDNYLLLQKLNFIMRTNRVDNSWRTPQPNFLNRVALYEPIIVPEIEELVGLDFVEDEESKSTDRRSKCYACTPQKLEGPKIPEERVPWEPDKKLRPRTRSRSVPSRKKLDEHLPTIREHQSQPSSKPSSSQGSGKCRTNNQAKLETSRTNKSLKTNLVAKVPQSIMLSRGCLKLSVNFPADTVVKFQEGNVDKFLMRGLCYCRNIPSATVNEILE